MSERILSLAALTVLELSPPQMVEVAARAGYSHVGLRLVPALKSNVMGLGACLALMAATFVAVALLRVPLIWVLLGLGGLGCLWAYRCLGHLAAQKEAS